MNKQFLIEEYTKSVSEAARNINNCLNINKSIAFCQYAGYLAWMFPFLERFSDDNLENIISSIAKKFTPIAYIPEERKIVFYNSQIVNNGALTEQYLDFFIKSEYQILFIIPDIKNTRLGNVILEKINNAANIKLFISEKKNNKEKIIEIRKLIAKFKAKYCFLHFTPNDVVGCLSFLNLKNTKTFYIVHNDHTFWIGKNFFDYYIEFRHFGISLAVERRRIKQEKILHIPFYPVKNDEPFKGFPFERNNKILGISGANLYKYLMDPELKYFKAIKELLVENSNFIFCLCGYGDSKTINKFIDENNLKDRFFFLGRRSDFYNLIGHADILFESYPMKGGLTPLFATEQKIPVIGIASYDSISGSLEELINVEGYNQPANFYDFKTEASRLINDPKYRIKLASLLSKNPCNKKDFENALSKVLSEDLTTLHPKIVKPLRLNDESNLQEYLDLKDATIDNLMRSKLFILKTSLPIISRSKLMLPAIKASNTHTSVSTILRIILLALGGK